jgi:hypothetical protein
MQQSGSEARPELLPALLTRLADVALVSIAHITTYRSPANQLGIGQVAIPLKVLDRRVQYIAQVVWSRQLPIQPKTDATLAVARAPRYLRTTKTLVSTESSSRNTITL